MKGQTETRLKHTSFYLRDTFYKTGGGWGGRNGDLPVFTLKAGIEKKIILLLRNLPFVWFKMTETIQCKIQMQLAVLGRGFLVHTIDYSNFPTTSPASWDATSIRHASRWRRWRVRAGRWLQLWYRHRLLRSLSSSAVWNQDAKMRCKPSGSGVPTGAAIISKKDDS